MTPAEKRKRGKQSKFARYNGEIVNGLCYWKTRGQYYCYYEEGGKKKKHYFSTQYNNQLVSEGLLFEFRKFQQQQGKEKISFIRPEYSESLSGQMEIEFSEEFCNKLEKAGLPIYVVANEIDRIRVNQANIPEGLVWEKCRDLIINDLDEAKKKLGLDIKLLSTVEPKSLTLVKLLELYNNRTREEGTINEQQLKEVQSFITQFFNIIKVKTIGEIKDEHIEQYRKRIINIYNKGYEKRREEKRLFNQVYQ